MDLRTCTKCKESKPMTSEFFHRTNKVKCGFVSVCKVCSAAYTKEYAKSKPEAREKWYAENRDRMLEYKKQHRLENIDRYRELKAIWNASNREYNKQWFAQYYLNRKNTEEHKNYVQQYSLANLERKKAADKLYRENNSAKLAAQSKIYYIENAEKIKAYAANYRKNNAHKKNAWNAAYELAKIQRTPKWLTDEDKFFIHEIYHLSSLRSKMTGIDWEVDHILPIQGKKVSGLHVPNNLQVIPHVVNNKKRNKFTPGDFPIKTNFFGV